MSSFMSEEGLSIFIFGAIGWAAAMVGGIYFRRFPLGDENKKRETMFIGIFVGAILILTALMFGIDTKDFE